MNFVRKVGLALRQAVPCKRVALSVVGLEVPHAHIHLIPLEEMDDIRFQKKETCTHEEMRQIAERIASYYKV